MSRNIVLIGMPGSGKTSIGKLLARKLNMKFIDLDEYIEKLTGESICKIFEKGEAYFRTIEEDAIEKVSKAKYAIISTGGGVIKKKRNIDLLKESGIIVFIDRPIEKIAQDVNIAARPLLAGGTERLYALFNERYDLYKKYCDIIINNTGSMETAADNIAKLVGECISNRE